MMLWGKDEITYLDASEAVSEKAAFNAKTHAERMEYLEELEKIKQIRKLDTENRRDPWWVGFLKTTGEVVLKVGGALGLAWAWTRYENNGTLLPKATDYSKTLNTIKNL